MRILIISLMLIIIAQTSEAAEAVLLQCKKTESVISKVKSLETSGENEYLHMVAKNGSKATIIRTYNSKFEKYKGAVDVDSEFYYYDYAECKFKFEGQSNIRVGLFFVNKRPLKQAKKNKIIVFTGNVDLPGSLEGTLTNSKGETLSYGGDIIRPQIFEKCKINEICRIKCEVNEHGYIEKILQIESIK